MSHTPKHARTTTTNRSMARRAAIAFAAVSATAVAVTGAGLASTAAPNVAYLRPAAYAASTLTPSGQVCKDFTTWEGKPTAANLAALTIDAARLSGKSYLKADTLEMLADLASPSAKAPAYAKKAEKYVSEDC